MLLAETTIAQPQAFYKGSKLAILPIKNTVIRNTGDLKTEMVWFEFTEDYDIGKLIIADNTYDSKGNPTNKLRHMHAFAHQVIKKGELCVLWTKAGTYNVGKNNNGGVQHNFFWNLKETVWNVGGDVGHFIEVAGIKNVNVGKFVS